jgi:hypothetical protein
VQLLLGSHILRRPFHRASSLSRGAASRMTKTAVRPTVPNIARSMA